MSVFGSLEHWQSSQKAEMLHAVEGKSVFAIGEVAVVGGDVLAQSSFSDCSLSWSLGVETIVGVASAVSGPGMKASIGKPFDAVAGSGGLHTVVDVLDPWADIDEGSTLIAGVGDLAEKTFVVHVHESEEM